MLKKKFYTSDKVSIPCGKFSPVSENFNGIGNIKVEAPQDQNDIAYEAFSLSSPIRGTVLQSAITVDTKAYTEASTKIEFTFQFSSYIDKASTFIILDFHEALYSEDVTVTKLDGCGDSDLVFEGKVIKTHTHDLLNISISKDINHNLVCKVLINEITLPSAKREVSGIIGQKQ